MEFVSFQRIIVCLILSLGFAFLLMTVFYNTFQIPYNEMGYVSLTKMLNLTNFKFEINGVNKSETSALSIIKNGTQGILDRTINTTEKMTTFVIQVAETERNFNMTKHKKSYLVSSESCHIPNLDPFNPVAMKYLRRQKYIPCTNLPLLTYINITNNGTFLQVNSSVMDKYLKNSTSKMHCCYSELKWTSEYKVRFSDKCLTFENKMQVHKDVVKVVCVDTSTKKMVYENVHSIIFKNSSNSSRYIMGSKRALSVLLIGVDSVSRLSFIRDLPETYRYLETHSWYPLYGYNKIGDNTFPNVLAFLTGFNLSLAQATCKPTKSGGMDKCPLIWKQFKEAGYVTAFAEDCGSIGTFEYNKKGFVRPPTDYYFRPYTLGTETLKVKRIDTLSYCTGPETYGERIMNLAKDFAVSFLDIPTFGYFWMNSFSHNRKSPTGTMDKPLKELLNYFTTSGVLENSIVIFLSDHGTRFGGIRTTYTGWLEERLPFIYFSFPKWFQTNFAREISNFKSNMHKLTNPYDLYMTFQHILILSGANISFQAAPSCTNCSSLFSQIISNRSCQDASIPQHWCTCNNYQSVKINNPKLKTAANFLTSKINEVISNSSQSEKCIIYKLNSTLRASEAVNNVKQSLFLIAIKMNPMAEFEATIVIDKNDKEKPMLLGFISRIDSYQNTSLCMSDSFLKLYCYCKKYLHVYLHGPNSTSKSKLILIVIT